ncbi:TAXI family TRAP transporter solute-binding subunit [Nisaea sp.]|uniref:TAXI family TRAP transporter solute-binding subunit n=1 Tax=Nisaea sp. TaxID=2024842 RepID=UPI003B520CC5
MKQVLKAALVAAPLAFAGTAADADTFVRMVSGPAGGSWYPLGAKIMQVFGEEVPGIATSNTSGGGISNVKAVDGGDAEIGWSYAHTSYNGYAGRGKFDSKHENIRHFATLYPATFQVAVKADSPIKTFEDMKNANISPGKAGWTGTAFAESILKAYGFDFAKIKENGGTVHYVSYTESVALMKDGHIDVFMAATSVPQASFIELQHSPGIRFIGLPQGKLDQIINDNPGYITGSIPKDAYEGLEADIPSLGIVTNMVVSKDLPDETVYQMCKSFWKNHATFAAVKKVWNRVKLEDALNGAAIPVHPGAKKCYDELGVKAAS